MENRCLSLIIHEEPPARKADGTVPNNNGYFDCRRGCRVELDQFSRPVSKSSLCPNRVEGVAHCRPIPKQAVVFKG